MVTQENIPRSTEEPKKSIEDTIESAYKNFLSLRLDSAAYKILLYIFWQAKAVSPKKLSKALNLTPSTVRDAVRQLHKIGLLYSPHRGVYEPDRDKCLAMILHTQRLLTEMLSKRK